MKSDNENRVQKDINRLYNNKLISKIILIVIILGGISFALTNLNSIVDSATSLYNKIFSNNNEIEQKLEGVVQDEVGGFIKDVFIMLPEYNLRDTTDSFGKYLFKLNAAREIKVTLIATKIGYAKYKSNPTLGNKNNNFILVKEKR